MKTIVILFALQKVCALAYTRLNPTYSSSTYIVGGEPAAQGELPYHVLLEFMAPLGNVCGGSIISYEWVLTAAHCLEYQRLSVLVIKYGDVRYDRGNYTKASRMVMHPFYNPRTQNNDMGLVKVGDPFPFSNLVKPIALANREPRVGSLAIVSGWGSTKAVYSLFWVDIDEILNNYHEAYILQKAYVRIIDISECRKMYYPLLVTDQMICAGHPRGGIDSCKGDSGGPLVVDDVQYGIISWGIGCGRPRYPGVYTKVSSLRRYIKSVTGV